MKSLLMSSLIAVILAGVLLCGPVQCAASTGLEQTVKACEEWYPLGEQVTFVYTLKNTSTQTLVYNFRTGMQFDMWVTYGGVEVYRSSRNMKYLQSLTDLTLNAGETKEFRTTWNQKDTRGRDVGTGWYTVHAQLECLREKPYEVSSRVWIGELTPVVVVPLTIFAGDATRRAPELVGKTVIISGTLREETTSTNPNRIGSKQSVSKLILSDSTGSIEVTGIDISRAGRDGKATLTGKIGQTAIGQAYLLVENATVSPVEKPNVEKRSTIPTLLGGRRTSK